MLELADGEKPRVWEDEPIPAAPGKSLVPAFSKDNSVAHDYLWWLHEDNRAVRVGDWKLVASKGDPWELYNLGQDRSESENLAASHPEKVRELETVWQQRLEEFKMLAAKTAPPVGSGQAKKNKRKSTAK